MMTIVTILFVVSAVLAIALLPLVALTSYQEGKAYKEGRASGMRSYLVGFVGGFFAAGAPVCFLYPWNDMFQVLYSVVLAGLVCFVCYAWISDTAWTKGANQSISRGRNKK